MAQSERFNLTELSKHVFVEKNGKLSIGGEEIDIQLRNVLRDEAEYFLKSRLFELLNATILNETMSMSLIQSTEWHHVESAKMLYHWNHVLKNMVILLAKK